jgi:hypothetical protein
MNDLRHADQLISGFYGVEENKWRWTAKQFTVGLGPPPGAGQRGAKLVVQLYIPDGHVEKLGPVKLRAEAGGKALAPETFDKGGSFTYARDVPAATLDTNLLPVTFTLDKAMPPSPGDGRELGAVVTAIGLEPKTGG